MKFGTDVLWHIRFHVAFIISAKKRFKVVLFAFEIYKFTLFFAFSIVTDFLLLKFKSLKIFKYVNYSIKNIQNIL